MTEQTEDGFTVSTAELAECAVVNFENIARANPMLKVHPMWQMAIEQLYALAHRLAVVERG